MIKKDIKINNIKVDADAYKAFRDAINKVQFDDGFALHMAELKGTDKQVGWALSIRDKQLDIACDKREEMCKALLIDEDILKGVGYDRDTLQKNLICFEAKIKHMAGKINSAKYWITNRDENVMNLIKKIPDSVVDNIVNNTDVDSKASEMTIEAGTDADMANDTKADTKETVGENAGESNCDANANANANADVNIEEYDRICDDILGSANTDLPEYLESIKGTLIDMQCLVDTILRDIASGNKQNVPILMHKLCDGKDFAELYDRLDLLHIVMGDNYADD